jgi:hypothetical protein
LFNPIASTMPADAGPRRLSRTRRFQTGTAAPLDRAGSVVALIRAGKFQTKNA